MSGNRIGLVMIVKDEAHVIVRCLDAVRPLLDYVLIVDTGSTDATCEVIAEYLRAHRLAGSVLQQPWRNFADNRSAALEALRQVEGIDYGFTIDADEILVLEEGFNAAAFKDGLTADCYDIPIRNMGTNYLRPMLFSNRKPFAYRGVLHEFLAAPPGSTRGMARGLHVDVTHDGARSRNVNKYADDARLLEAALRDETDPFLRSRYTFYLAQSYRDAGDPQRAYDGYLRRAEQGFWLEEVYVSLLRAAQLAEKLKHPADTQIALCLRAYEVNPDRAEALHRAAIVCRTHQRYHLGYLLARQGLLLALPENGLFVDREVYAFRMLDEFQVNAYWAGHYRESLDAAATLLHDNLYPPSEQPRLTANADFAMQKVMAA